jgi:hypothetical protein
VRWWKILGLAGFAGVAATGVVIARAERQRRAYTPDQVRERLHARLAETPDPTTPALPSAEIHALNSGGIARRAHIAFPENGQSSATAQLCHLLA